MTSQPNPRTILAGACILLLGSDNDSTSELGLKLSLHGGTVLAIGTAESALARLRHEVRDAGGSLSYGLFDYTEPATAQHASAYLQTRGAAVYALVDNTGQPDHRYTCALLDAWERQTRLALPEHIVTIHPANGGPCDPLSGPAGIRTVSIYTDLSQDALPCTARHTPVAADLYSAVLAREVTYALGAAAYRAVRQIALVDEGDDILARLYASDEAPLQTIRRGRIQRVYVAHVSDRGRAVFAGCDFYQGDLIFEMNGTPLDHQTEHTIQIDWNRHLEPDSPIRLLNHSCEPNIGVKTNANGLPDFYAFRDIQQGEELTFDYAMTEYTHYPRADETLEFDLGCRCGAANCRGKLGYYSDLSEATKQQYAGFVSAYFMTPPPA